MSRLRITMPKWEMTYANKKGLIFSRILSAPTKVLARKKAKQLCNNFGWVYRSVSERLTFAALAYHQQVVLKNKSPRRK